MEICKTDILGWKFKIIKNFMQTLVFIHLFFIKLENRISSHINVRESLNGCKDIHTYIYVCVCVCMKSLQNKIGKTIAIEYKIERIAVKIKNYGPHLQCYAQFIVVLLIFLILSPNLE